MAKKYTLLPIPLKQGFANGGIKQRVPYQLPATDDDLNWLEGFTDAYQRPVITENLGEKGGRYVRMGQINQILENISQAFLNVKQSLNNVSETIDKGILIEVDKVITNANNALANLKVAWLQTSGNQKCGGLKNFTSININNFKNTPAAVANLEWCNGLPIKTVYRGERFKINTSYTITLKNAAYSIGGAESNLNLTLSFLLDSKVIFKSGSFSANIGYLLGSNKQVFRANIENFVTDMYYTYGN